MSVYFEGSAAIDGGQAQYISMTNSSIGNCSITSSTLDMNLANITSVKNPVSPQDAATKSYVDNLGILVTDITLTGTSDTVLSSIQQGSYVMTVMNNVINGPTGIFHLTKNEASRFAQVARTVASPGYSSNTMLRVSWPPNSGILIRKTDSGFDGSYKIKLL